uniref:Galectin n=1 Tax=Paramisgurnus dabryanus TaxID=90735 RepID=A0A0R6LJS6_PARDA|nr:lgals1 [Paramisgurnus dabryanus]
MVFTVSDLGFQAGRELCITGRVKPNCKVFSINFGYDFDNIAFHFNPRFNIGGIVKTIVCNSKKGDWSEEQRYTFFPFERGKEFKVSFTFNHENFYAKLTDGNMITFPNRFGTETFNHLHVAGDVTVSSMVVT